MKLAIKANYISGIGEAYRVKGIGHSYLNDKNQAVKNYLEAVKYFKINKDLKQQARVYNNIGNLYRFINYNKALEYYKKSLKITKNFDDEELKAGLFFNIASILRLNSKFRQALFYYNSSNKIFIARKDTVNIIINLLNTGIVYYQIKEYKEAEFRINKAIEGSEKKKLFTTLIGCYTTLSKINYELNEYSEAKINIKEGLKYSKIVKNKNFEHDLIHAAYLLENKQKNYKKALQYLIQVHKYDSLLLSKNQTDNIDKTSSYYIQQQQIQENELIIAQQKYRETLYWWTLTIIFSLILFTALIGISTYALLQKKRKRKDIEIENRVTMLEQKTLQAMVNPHFIFNVLNTIQYFISQDDSQEANKILSIFANLMRKHLEICLKSSITLMEEMEYLSLYLSLEKIRFSEKMKYNITVSNNIDGEEIILPPMLIQPFIENAIWHGIMPKETGGLIDIDFTCQNDELRIRITDNGIGISNSIKNKTSGHISRGLELIEERVSLLNKLNIKKISINKVQTGESGTEVIITIPV
ncbi:tetratricopeptide repeat-containing sensor histidine kinase [Daejeonella rubra]|uniref:tetratricopeptide repeat-containing sensor histidine kinase n=1 Tax=Daejeonella rubra TaxID=990371 RepID=UPI0015A0D833|nr:histidine kinase [Daejeonella rubra]